VAANAINDFITMQENGIDVYLVVLGNHLEWLKALVENAGGMWKAETWV
jgi:hypothetical protein